MWRLVAQEVATVSEMDGPEAVFSFDDIMRANAVLDMREDIQRQQREDAEASRK